MGGNYYGVTEQERHVAPAAFAGMRLGWSSTDNRRVKQLTVFNALVARSLRCTILFHTTYKCIACLRDLGCWCPLRNWSSVGTTSSVQRACSTSVAVTHNPLTH
jgi:hypothetical protein